MDKEALGTLRVVALAGGVGGARLADGLAQILLPQNLTIVVNVGDDFEHLGLLICPDLDTMCYTLAGLANPETGWGRAGESWQALDVVRQLGGPAWFGLGDRDLGLHLERTRLRRLGLSLSQATHQFCKALGIGPTVLPVTDDSTPTWVYTKDGTLPFQEYFVQRRCEPQVTGFHFAGAQQARPAPGVLEALSQADLALICPSNPWVSIDPILAIPGLRPALAALPVAAVSPIIGGQAVKGPAAKMFAELGLEPSALAVARHYGSRSAGGLLSGFILDQQDAAQAVEIEALGMRTLTTDTLMKNGPDRARLGKEVVAFAYSLLARRNS
jgi:LPPG:FO 2-phospho-L-lactate transferase